MTSVDERMPAPVSDGPPPGPWALTSLLLAADLGRLDHVAGYVREVAVRAGVGDAAAYRLRLAVEELAVNAIVHGYAGRPGELLLAGGGDHRGAWVVVEDRAPAFDPRGPRFAVPAHLPAAERPIGGLGIHLTLTAADEYAYEYRCGANRSTVVVRRRPGEEA